MARCDSRQTEELRPTRKTEKARTNPGASRRVWQIAPERENRARKQHCNFRGKARVSMTEEATPGIVSANRIVDRFMWP
jgi:hypothetical protein